jgi:hypothetical protein
LNDIQSPVQDTRLRTNANTSSPLTAILIFSVEILGRGFGIEDIIYT